MSGILSSVQQVRDIMDEISSASEEQSRGISQVGIAVSELDQVTQQNAALVEQSSSAAASLEEQAARLNEAVAVFRLAGRKEVARRSGVTALKSPVLATASTDNWEAF
jgi:methyl-accepting chemotaxis protein-1 (serine sensor receptor)